MNSKVMLAITKYLLVKVIIQSWSGLFLNKDFGGYYLTKKNLIKFILCGHSAASKN